MESDAKLNSGKAQFLKEVFPSELDEVKKRRTSLGLDTSALSGAPRDQNGLVGLALSGGGIRSATFCLGALQALAKRGLLRYVDYLSTVSGGGFTGAAVSSSLEGDDAGVEAHNFPFRVQPGVEETPSSRHLRNSARYLAPGGILDRMRLGALLLRGVLINFLLFLPYIMIAVVLTQMVFLVPETSRQLLWILPFLAPAIFLLSLAAYPLLSKIVWARLDWVRRDGFERLLGFFLLLTLISLACIPAAILINEARNVPWPDFVTRVKHALANPSQTEDIWEWLLALGVFVLLGRLGHASRFISKWKNKLTIYVIGLLGPLLLCLAYLILCVFQIESPYFGVSPLAEVPLTPGNFYAVTNIGRGLPDGLGIALYRLRGTPSMTAKAGETNWAVAFTNTHPHRYFEVTRTKDRLLLFPDFRAELRQGIISDDLRKAFARKGGLSATAEVFLASGSAPEAEHLSAEAREYMAAFNHWVGTDGGKRFNIWEDNHKLRTDKIADWGDAQDWGFLAVALVFLLGNSLWVNVNVTSVHSFYRDCLSMGYLFLRRGGRLRANDRQLLSHLHSRENAPYHIINVALNLSESPEAIIRGRQSEFFFFSKQYCGSEITGFCPTPLMEKTDQHLNLGTAMAISGAAASPNAGVTTVQSLRFILTLLNVRLGYWFPNPSVALRARRFRRWFFRRGPTPLYLINEAIGRLRPAGAFVYLSDGGHIENLGIYELLRRRCQVIISVDSEADPSFRFAGLLRLITYARVDMGIDIDIDLSKVRENEKSLNQTHYVIGRIHYGRDQVGTLIYFKSSITGDETEAVRDYRVDSPDFPHESTTNQFFGESQFESYRWLGSHVVESSVLQNPELAELISGRGPNAADSGNVPGRTESRPLKAPLAAG
ncbi:MAG: patatin-like phospholipase family protein [Limisphaerales bacterium]